MTEEPPDLTHLWAAVGANPEDALPRLVAADWLEEREGAECGRCGGSGRVAAGWWRGELEAGRCPACDGAGRVSNGYADLAAALRATAGRVPNCHMTDAGCWSWVLAVDHHMVHRCSIRRPVFDHLKGTVPPSWPSWRDYPTAESAIRALCRAWVVTNKGVPA